MRIRCRSRRPVRSAAPSSTSKELPRCSSRLSRYLNPHGAVLTCPTRTATPSPIPPMKLRPTRRHQGGSALTAAFYLLFDLTGLSVLDTEQPWWVSIDGAVAGHFIHVIASSAATSCCCSALLLLSVAMLLRSCSCSCCCSTLSLARTAAAARPPAAT